MEAILEADVPLRQQTTRDYANTMFALIQPIEPIAVGSWSASSARVGHIAPCCVGLEAC
jgi:hypothetical protein